MRRALVIGCLAGLAGLFAGCGPSGDREVRRGIRDLKRGEPVLARTRFEAAIRRNPGAAANASIHNAAGVACWRMGDLTAARAAFEESRRLDPSVMAPACNLGLLLARSGQARDALVLLEEAALLDLDRTEALEALASTHGQSGQWEAAVRVLDEALSRQPESPRILAALAYPLLQLGQPEAARKSLVRALEIDKDYAPALFNLTILQGTVLADPVRAADTAKRFLKKNRRGEHAEMIRTLLKKWADAPPPKDTPPPREAPRANLQEDVRIEPWTDSPRPPSGADAPPSASPLEAAQREATEGRTDAALAICLRESDEARLTNDLGRREKALQLALQFAFDRAEAHMAYGMFLEERKNWSSASRSYQKALLLDPASVEAALSLARVAVASGQPKLARQTLEAAVEEHPKNPDLLFQLARLYEEVFEESIAAAEQYRSFLDANPQDARADAVRRKLRLPAGRTPVRTTDPIAPMFVEKPRDPVPAVSPLIVPWPSAPDRKLVLNVAPRKNPQAARQAIQRGLEHRQRGDLERAEYYFTRAVENDERVVAAFQYLAEIHSQRGDHDLALDAYRKVIEFGADNSGNRYNLATAHYARKDPAAALAELDLALRMNPQFPAALYLYGLILSNQPGRLAEARAYFSRYLSVSPPEDPLATAVRDWLKNPGAGRAR
jgi:tetratricopeptide (TPR) repeat protein